MNEPKNIYIYRPDLPSELRQGDIISQEDLKPTLEGHQKFFADTKLFAEFIVMTQSCDLARGGSVEFISLAGIRRLENALLHRKVADRSKDATSRLVRDLINYSYHKRGFFYLPQDPGAYISEDSVVDIRVMFSLSRRHYQRILAARLCGLREIFAAKLGSMAGEMFSRIPVPSWDERYGRDEGKKFIKRIWERFEARQAEKLGSLRDERGSRCECMDGSERCDHEADTYCWRVNPTTFEDEYKVVCRKHADELEKQSDDTWAK